jgi:chloramphenicol 3-O-phosphotransferase|tara:strand:+ start:14725 stop:15153 length:429 start_codon:yes stop_codon:yes gene_type:complete
MAKKKEFKSNVTGEEWHKHSSKRWNKTINQIGVIMEDEVHQGKNGTTVTLTKGSEVIIDDIRGRIKPQYRVKDINGKIWFVSALNVEVIRNESREADVSGHGYRGGVRHDGTRAAPYRYEVSKTTKQELDELKATKKKKGEK